MGISTLDTKGLKDNMYVDDVWTSGMQAFGVMTLEESDTKG